MEFLTADKRPKREHDLTALINIIFLILIFFMITAVIAPGDDASVEPVVTALEGEPATAESVVITVLETGNVLFDGRPVDEAALPAQLQQAASANTELPLSIKADAMLNANTLIGLIAQASEAGFKSVSLMTVRR